MERAADMNEPPPREEAVEPLEPEKEEKPRL
jgi:hypothetical protein